MVRSYYIFPLQGRGLWGQIYGNLALEEDLNTVGRVHVRP